MTPIPTVGTVLSMSPASGTVAFQAPEAEPWALPLIGFAVLVTYVDPDDAEYETSLSPVVLAEGACPTTLHDYRQDAHWTHAQITLKEAS